MKRGEKDDFEREATERDIYNKEERENQLESDEISPEEEAFMVGWEKD